MTLFSMQSNSFESHRNFYIENSTILTSKLENYEVFLKKNLANDIIKKHSSIFLNDFLELKLIPSCISSYVYGKF